jgi:outer membrane protein
MLKKTYCAMLAISMVSSIAVAQAETRIGFVNTERIFREAPAAVKAQKKIEKEFEKRDQDLQKLAKQLQTMQDSLEKDGVTLADSDRRNREREFSDQNRNEELAVVLERANKTIKQIAEAEKYDIILQEAVYASPRIDITEKVIKALGDAGK